MQSFAGRWWCTGERSAAWTVVLRFLHRIAQCTYFETLPECQVRGFLESFFGIVISTCRRCDLGLWVECMRMELDNIRRYHVSILLSSQAFHVGSPLPVAAILCRCNLDFPMHSPRNLSLLLLRARTILRMRVLATHAGVACFIAKHAVFPSLLLPCLFMRCPFPPARSLFNTGKDGACGVLPLESSAAATATATTTARSSPASRATSASPTTSTRATSTGAAIALLASLVLRLRRIVN